MNNILAKAFPKGVSKYSIPFWFLYYSDLFAYKLAEERS